MSGSLLSSGCTLPRPTCAVSGKCKSCLGSVQVVCRVGAGPSGILVGTALKVRRPRGFLIKDIGSLDIRSIGLCGSTNQVVCKILMSNSYREELSERPTPRYPLAAIALTFSTAASFMALFRRVSQQRRILQEKAEKEFCNAAEKNLPWKIEMTHGLARSAGISMALLSATAKDHLTPVLHTLRANPTFMAGLIAWALAQVMKIFTYYIVVRKWDFRMVLGSGGMPSSHSALCFALTTSVALVHGVADSLFPVCLGFTLIVMYDAAGVRRHAGKQAEILNIIVADMFQGHPISERKLKELLGHTPLQVFAGAALGIFTGYLCSFRG